MFVLVTYLTRMMEVTFSEVFGHAVKRESVIVTVGDGGYLLDVEY